MANEDFELGGSTLAYKLNWNDLIIQYIRECGRYYALSHITRGTYGPIYVCWVKNLYSILIPYINKQYEIDVKEGMEKLEERYVKLRISKHWETTYKIQYEIDKYFNIFECLMKVIKKEGFLQTKGITVSMPSVNDSSKPV